MKLGLKIENRDKRGVHRSAQVTIERTERTRYVQIPYSIFQYADVTRYLMGLCMVEGNDSSSLNGNYLLANRHLVSNP